MHTIGCDITEALKHISNEEYNLVIKKKNVEMAYSLR